MNLDNYFSKIGILKSEVGNITQWFWPLSDNQTYNIIMHDWVIGIEPILKEYFKNGRTVIQAGGNCGVYPLLYTQYFKNVYTFEPDPINFFCLNLNCQMTNIIKFNCALGEEPDIAVMQEVAEGNRGMNQVSKVNEQSTNTVPIVTIDSFEFKDVDLIQFDLEGFEQFAIKGAVKTIDKYKPMIIMETAHNSDNAMYQINCNILKDINYLPVKQITRLDTIFTYEGKF